MTQGPTTFLDSNAECVWYCSRPWTLNSDQDIIFVLKKLLVLWLLADGWNGDSAMGSHLRLFMQPWNWEEKWSEETFWRKT